MWIIKAVGLPYYVTKLHDSDGAPFYTLTEVQDDAYKFDEFDAIKFMDGLRDYLPGSFIKLPIDEQINLW